ncbi:MAG TPA: hypothetical protein DEH02_16645 [Bacteroidales bacterium]|nr:MAG: hypothetical protein A2X01_19860 [Bacteroidetes bacterium GWF2_35_48]OFZ01723.1 MAG: hypothetical protein A2491_20245 [Bacteroidetes bacterium RIFOXYC12_FULL_35_7]HBX52695.1 hypothetical protein [Bacteroidales bacterium]
MKKSLLLLTTLYFLSAQIMLAQDLIRFMDKSGFWGYKDKKTDKVKIKAEWDYAYEFDSSKTTRVCKGCRNLGLDLWDFSNENVLIYGIDKNGVTFEPHGTGTVYETDHLIIGRSDGLYGIFREGDVEFIPQYNKIEPTYPFAGNFLIMKDNLWGMINSKGDIVLPMEYNKISSDDGNYFILQKGENNFLNPKKEIKRGIANKNGKILVPLGDNGFSNISNGVCILAKTIGGKLKYGIVDTLNREIVPSKYDNVYSFYNGLIPVCINCEEVYVGDNLWIVHGSWGIVDKNGKEIIAPSEGKGKIDQMLSFQEGMVWFCQGCRFDKTSNWRKGLWKGGKYGFIDSLGKIIVPAIYDSAQIFINGLAKVVIQKNKIRKIGFIDRTGKEVIPLTDKYKDITFFNEGLAAAFTGRKFAYIDLKGNEAIPAKFDEAENFYNGYAVVTVNEKKGLINTKGEFIIIPEYETMYPDHWRKDVYEVRKNEDKFWVNLKNEKIFDK